MTSCKECPERKECRGLKKKTCMLITTCDSCSLKSSCEYHLPPGSCCSKYNAMTQKNRIAKAKKEEQELIKRRKEKKK